MDAARRPQLAAAFDPPLDAVVEEDVDEEDDGEVDDDVDDVSPLDELLDSLFTFEPFRLSVR